MSVIVVNKKAHNAFKFFSVIVGILAVISICANILLGFQVTTVKTDFQETQERLLHVSEQLQAQTEENKKLTDKIEKKKIAMLAVSQEVDCLAKNIYFEAGGESYTGKQAVAHVVLNRMNNPEFPKKACDVVYQGAGDNKAGCQFSWVCAGVNKAVSVSSKAWQESKDIAIAVLNRREQLPDVTNGALYFHAIGVRPAWATRQVTAKIGDHIFYR